MTIDGAALLAHAAEAAEHAYVPYSRFRVGAVAVTADGRRFVGVNVENAAYGSTICAEGSATSAAVTAGARDIDTVAVYSLDGHDCFPCGNCLQLMHEFGVATVIVADAAGAPVAYPLEALLPHGFGPESLSPPTPKT